MTQRNTELVSDLLSVSSVLYVVYYLSLVGICILLVNIVWFLTIIVLLIGYESS